MRSIATRTLVGALLTVVVLCSIGLTSAPPAAAIWRGETDDAGRYPWLVSIGRAVDFGVSSIPHKCGGTVIDDTHVLTAAHCVFTKDGQGTFIEGQDVIAGSNLGPVRLPLNALEIISATKPDDADADIAVATLSRPIPDARPVRLAPMGSFPAIGSRANVVGRGCREADGYVGKDKNKPCPGYPDAPGNPRRTGQRILTSNGRSISVDGVDPCGPVLPTILCGWADPGAVRAGDSGGPLLITDNAGNPVQVGVVDFILPGLGLDPWSTSYYAAIGAYRDWIDRQLSGPSIGIKRSDDVAVRLTNVDDRMDVLVNGRTRITSAWGMTGVSPTWTYHGHSPGQSGLVQIGDRIQADVVADARAGATSSLRFELWNEEVCCGVSGTAEVLVNGSVVWTDRIQRVDSRAGIMFSRTVTLRIDDDQSVPAPAARWAFDDCVGDRSDVGDIAGTHPGTAVGGPACRTLGNGRQALSFDGRDDVLVVEDSVEFHAGDRVSLEAVVNPATVLGDQTLVSKWYAPDSYSLSIRDGRFWFSVAFPGGKFGVPVGVSSEAGAGVWSHVVGVFDGATIHLYVNGSEVASAPAAGVLQQSDRPITICGHPSWAAFTGALDDVAVYRAALRSADVAILATAKLRGLT